LRALPVLSVLRSCLSRIHLPAHLPSARLCFPCFSRLLTAAVLCGLWLLPGARTPDRSLRLLRSAFRTSRPQPRRVPRTSLSQSPQRVRPDPLPSPGFASARRLANTRRRNGFVILRAIRSPPVASHPASRRRSYLRLHL